MVGVRDQIGVIEEREAHIVAGGEDDGVDVLDRVVLEPDLLALQRLDRRLELDVAAAGPGQEFAADRGVGFQGLMVGLGQAVVFHTAEGLLDHLAGHGQAQLAGHPMRQGRFVRRLAVHVFGQHPHPAPGGDPQVFGDRPLGQLAGDVHRRVAHADDHDVLAAHVDRVERVAIGVAVEGRPVELAGIVRDARAPVVAVADEQHVVQSRFAGRQGHFPQAVGVAPGLLDRGVEGDRLTQAKVVDVVLEILMQLGVVRKVRPVAGDGEVLERQSPFGRVDVQAFVAGRHAVGVAIVPVAADLVGDLETVVGDAHVLESFGGRETRAAGPDDAGLGQTFGHYGAP